MMASIKRLLENHRASLVRWGLIAFALFAPAYLVSTGRQSTTEALVGVVVLAAVWKAVGPVGFLSLLAMFIWASRGAPGMFYRLTGPIWETANLIEVGIYGWLAFLLASQVIRKRQGQLSFVRPSYLGLLAVFLLGGGLALMTGVAPDDRYAWAMLWRTCVAPLALYVLVANYVRRSEDGERVLWGLVLGSLVLSVVQLTGWGLVGSTATFDVQGERLAGSYSLGPLGVVGIGLNTGAVFFSLSAVLAWSLALNAQRGWQRWFAVMAVMIFSWAIFQMGTRSVWIALPVAFLTVTLLSVRRGVAQIYRVGLLVGLIVAGALIVVGLEQLDQEILRRIETMASAQTLLADSTWLGRVELWKSGISILSRNPLGTGYIPTLPPFYYSTHSEYLALGLATGIEGLVAFLTFMLLWARRILAAIKSGSDSDWVLPGTFGSLIAYLIAAIAADPSKRFYPYMAFWMVLSVGMAVAEKSLLHKTSSPLCPASAS